jgi:hypothetical protein
MQPMGAQLRPDLVSHGRACDVQHAIALLATAGDSTLHPASDGHCQAPLVTGTSSPLQHAASKHVACNCSGAGGACTRHAGRHCHAPLHGAQRERGTCTYCHKAALRVHEAPRHRAAAFGQVNAPSPGTVHASGCICSSSIMMHVDRTARVLFCASCGADWMVWHRQLLHLWCPACLHPALLWPSRLPSSLDYSRQRRCLSSMAHTHG